MADISNKQIEQLQQAFARPERLADGAMLAGGALALPMLDLRRRQAAMEAMRAANRHGDDHPETRRRRAQAAALAARSEQAKAEVDRQTLVKPPLGDQAGLYGRVTRKGEPVPGVAVSALDASGEMLSHGCTGLNGDYTLSFPPDRPVAVEVRDDNRRLFRDESAIAYPPYRATYRDIELSKAKPPCPDDKPAEPAGTVQVPELIRRQEDEALNALKALGLTLGRRSTRRDRTGGMVLEQTPAAGTPVAPGSAVDILVSERDERPAHNVGDLTGKSLHLAIEEIRAAGAELGAVNVVAGEGRTPLVREARPDPKGEKVDLDVSVAGGDAQLMNVVATVLPATAEGAALDLPSGAAATEWLKKYKLNSLEAVGELQAADDAKLRRRVGLKAEDDVAPVRALLQAAATRVRKV